MSLFFLALPLTSWISVSLFSKSSRNRIQTQVLCVTPSLPHSTHRLYGREHPLGWRSLLDGNGRQRKVCLLSIQT